MDGIKVRAPITPSARPVGPLLTSYLDGLGRLPKNFMGFLQYSLALAKSFLTLNISHVVVMATEMLRPQLFEPDRQ